MAALSVGGPSRAGGPVQKKAPVSFACLSKARASSEIVSILLKVPENGWGGGSGGV